MRLGIISNVNTARIGTSLRAIRLRKGWSQADVARRSGVPRGAISDAERGLIGRISVDQLEGLARTLGAQLDIWLRWHGDELDRLLNRDHSAMHEQLARLLEAIGSWTVAPEVSFAIYGERGIIDILAFHERSGRLLVIELKTVITDIQELIGSVDRKHRLARQIARERSWHVLGVSAWLVVAATRTNDRRIAAHRTTLRSAFPVDGRSMRGWLVAPNGDVAAMSTMPSAAGASIRVPLAGRRRATGANRGGRRSTGPPAAVADPREHRQSLVRASVVGVRRASGPLD